MNIYKDFIYNIRKIECETPYLIVIKEYPPIQLYSYIKTLITIPFTESCYNLYYGELKKTITSFLNFYSICTGRTVVLGIDYKHTLNYKTLMSLYDNTVDSHEASHQEFLKEFQPIESDEEKEKFNTIQSLYNSFKERLLKFGERIKLLNYQEGLDNFAKDHFVIGMKKIHQICDYAHLYISKWLAGHANQIHISLEETLRRIRTNQVQFKKDYKDHMNVLYNELYELNKENVAILRKDQHFSHEAALNRKSMAALKNKIQSSGCDHIFNRLNQEEAYWSRRLADLHEITRIITKIEKALENALEDEKTLSTYELIELPEAEKQVCWQNMNNNIKDYKNRLEKKYIEACRPLLTFFSTKGMDHILYSDDVGSYYYDEYGHQNYISQYGAKYYHVNCKGEYVEKDEHQKYYFDKNGRYIFKDGKKVYQLAPCTNLNTLTENGLWSELSSCTCNKVSCLAKVPYGTCTIAVNDASDEELLPKTEDINIEKTLDSGTVKYLWDSFGWILPEVLNEVGKAKPRNPIHYLAHLLLSRSHSCTVKEIKARRKEGIKYREDIINQRKKELQERARAWKAKQVKPYKTFDNDNSLESNFYRQYEDSQQAVADLAMYYTN